MTMTPETFRILVVDDEAQYRDVLQMILKDEGFQVDTADHAEKALAMLSKKHYHLVLSDLIMGGMDGLGLLETTKERYPDIEVILVTGYGSVKNAVEAMKKGAFSYFIKSHDPDELLLEISKLMEITSLKQKYALMGDQPYPPYLLETKNPQFQETLRIAKAAASSSANILLLGESGVGKEVIASYIHQHSPRWEKNFIPVNCHALSDTLLESELFGHEKGAFTGATERRIGRFEGAHNGTLFLDEIGDMSPSTQVKLLRSFESRTVERLGSHQSIPVDFRLISATHQNLKSMVARGEFREDFYYRVSTITVEIPPLRARREDLENLIHFFITQSQKDMKRRITHVDDSLMAYLLTYDYPGNIRELKNMIERLVVLAPDDVLRLSDISKGTTSTYEATKVDESLTLKGFRAQQEKTFIIKALQKTDYNMTQTAKRLGISRRQLFNKINEYGISKTE